MKECPCGSGKPREEIYDARGIFVAFVCDDCRASKLDTYRRDIFTNPSYWTDEPVESD